MRAVVQRVLSAQVAVDGECVGRCGQGLVVFVAAHKDDTEKESDRMADRVAGLRIFGDQQGKMNLSLDAVPNTSVLAISNFTLYGDVFSGRRPSFAVAAGYDDGKRLFDRFVMDLRKRGITVETGIFGADMKVTVTNDGPVTLLIDVNPST